jgi:chromosome segregation ATPase
MGQLQALTQWRAQVQDNIEVIQKQIVTLLSQLDQLEQQLSAGHITSAQYNVEATSLQDTLASFMSEERELQSTLATINAEIATIQQSLNQSNKSMYGNPFS